VTFVGVAKGNHGWLATARASKFKLANQQYHLTEKFKKLRTQICNGFNLIQTYSLRLHHKQQINSACYQINPSPKISIYFLHYNSSSASANNLTMSSNRPQSSKVLNEFTINKKLLRIVVYKYLNCSVIDCHVIGCYADYFFLLYSRLYL